MLLHHFTAHWLFRFIHLWSQASSDESAQHWKARTVGERTKLEGTTLKSINEYFKSILQNNTKLNIALAKLRARFQQSTCRHCIFQHLDKVLCLLIYCLFNFSELSEWLKSTLIHELLVAKYSVNCKLNEGCIRLPWKNKVTFKNIGLLALNSLWLASDFLFRDEKLPLNDLVLPWLWTLISPLNVL